MIRKDNFIIITGGPGAGKTSLIDELSTRGYRCVPEVARQIIREEMSKNGEALPWKNITAYSSRMLEDSIRDFRERLACDDLHFFDRGIPDTYGYERLLNRKISPDLWMAVQEYRYNQKAFILPFWESIYKTDKERKQDLQTAKETYYALKNAYEEAGYQPIIVPCVPITERVDFILENMVAD